MNKQWHGMWMAGMGLALAGIAPAAIAQEAAVPIAGVEASSSRSSYFAAWRVHDDSLTTAWAPAANQADPTSATLTLRLARTAVVSALGLKLDPAGTLVDVAALEPNGAWRTIATGLRPGSGTLVRLNLPNVTASQVRLTFRANVDQLKVCDVRIYAGATPTASPTLTPTPRPSWTPTPKPSAGLPVGDRGWHVTGGGFVMQGGNKVSFGLTAQDGRRGKKADKGDSGNIQVVFHGKPTRQFHGRVSSVQVQGNTVTLHGTLKDRRGVSFTAVLVDRGEPGRQDSFRFSTSTGQRADGTLRGGNIQLHPRR